ncbi:MAG: HIT domain-containing protein [Candidatus Vogelbacteria bacterium]|nr:HIT domain-containing protein [Candidatus Vogelbacteria bacterium]
MLYTDFLKEMKECPFCDTTQRIILKNDRAFMTYSLAPYHKHHLLVIPHQHVVSYLDLNQSENEDILKLLKIGMEMMVKLGYTSSSILVRDGDVSNKSIAHLHYHIIPNIKIGDLDHYGESRRIMTEDEISETLSEINRVYKKLEIQE